jgi:hypothetical protein
MKIAINALILALSVDLSMAGLATSQTAHVLPTADDVVARMVQLEAQRKAELYGYTATRHYVLVNKQHRAEMLVKVTCASDGEKQFTVLSEEGSSAIPKLLFSRMLREETEASTGGARNNTDITPANYNFRLIRRDFINGRPAYLLDVTPKEDNKYLIDGRIWVDDTDYSIVRVEGSPSRNLSFLIHSVHFEHTYQKVGPFWFVSSTHAMGEIRSFGEAELTIETSGYALNPPLYPRAS